QRRMGNKFRQPDQCCRCIYFLSTQQDRKRGRQIYLYRQGYRIYVQEVKMKLKDRLSLYAVTAFSMVMLLASSLIYISFYKWMVHNQFRELQNKTLLAAVFYLEADEQSHPERESVKNQLQKT